MARQFDRSHLVRSPTESLHQRQQPSRPPSSDAFRRGRRRERQRWLVGNAFSAEQHALEDHEHITHDQSAVQRRHGVASALREIHSFVQSFEALAPNERAEEERRLVERRANVDHAISQANAASGALRALREDVLVNGHGPFDEVRERAAMMQLVQALAISHQHLIRRYQELQLTVAVTRALDERGAARAGISRERLNATCPSISYSAVLRGSRGYDLPGDGECAVCQCDLHGAERVRLLPCRHVYHCECCDPWLERSNSCPTCRTAVLTCDINAASGG